MINELLERQVKFPFLSVLENKKTGELYFGLVQNQTKRVTNIYILNDVKSFQLKLFLDLASTWWWESNRKMPINIFLRDDLEQFKYCVRRINTIELIHHVGPVTSISTYASRRVKRKTIRLKK
jgi:hypothetical protein